MPLIEDWRVPSLHSYVIVNEGEGLVKIPDSIRKCVGFVIYESKSLGREVLAGTAFFVSEDLAGPQAAAPGGPQAAFLWIVTAAHVVNGVESDSVDGTVRLRVNARAGGVMTITSQAKKWARHPTADVAIIGLPFSVTSLADLRLWPLGDRNLALDATIAEEGIGIGDDLFFPGLFKHHPGAASNVPIVRTGAIAAMPGEPIHLRYWGEMSAYLVETRSIGGLSGSPVFVHLGNVRTGDKGLQVISNKYGRYMLLGVMSGHYKGTVGVGDIGTAIEDADSAAMDDEEREINMGIGIVVPVQRLMEVVKRPELEAAKAKERDRILAENAGNAVADTAIFPIEPSAPADEPALTRGGFEDALRKVSQRKAAPNKR